MNKRERLLAIGAGAIGVLIFLYFSYAWVAGMYTARYKKIAELEKQQKEQKRLLDQGKKTALRVKGLEARALPPNVAHASSIYREFLVDTAVNKAGLKDVKVNPMQAQAKKGVYNRLPFTLTAEGNLEQLTRFLYLFYSVDYLHRVQSMRVVPSEKSKNLGLFITIDALSLPGAAHREKLASGPAQRLALASEADYQKDILERNLFAPPNIPPKISAISTQSGETKKLFSLTFKASDADNLDRLKFDLDAAQHKGAVLKPGDAPKKPGESHTAQFSFTPPKAGEYTFAVRVVDDGIPAREDKKTFKVVVKDPRREVVGPTRPVDPPKPKFDVAKYTYLTSIVETGGVSGIWLIERTTGKRHELKEGDKFDIGQMKGTIVKIGLQDVEIEVGGKRMMLPLGSTLSEAFAL